jgi:leucyl-tRNA synthetase
VATDTDEETVKQIALADERVKKFIDGRNIKKVIYVKGKLVNIVI